ncbi:hypothetical protein ACGF5O_48140 [Streptomyces sp. NPDC048291]|uniref:hypothetical protein n=1 Tax=Streptomyces sp. NPDC048291 TaxID=3365530 RepID=UPI00371E5304
MVRGALSGADRELIGRLAALDVVVSGAQLERWRAAGLLPGHARRWLGRGLGSVSVLAEETVAVAAALRRHARPGRDLRWTVIGWYAEAGLPAGPGELVVPEPPWAAVRDALAWAVAGSSAQRLVVQARAAGRGSEEEQDAFYTEAGRVAGRGLGLLPHPDAVRRMVEDPDAAWEQGPERAQRRGLVHLAAAAGMGAGEVGGEALAEALAALMPGIDWESVADDARRAESEGTLESWIPAGAMADPLTRLQAAGEEELAAARDVTRQLTLVGFLYVMHGFLMPDTPVLARMRDRVDGSGLAQFIAQLVPSMSRPSGVPHALLMGLTPGMAAVAAWLNAPLNEQIATGGGLLGLSDTGEEGGAEAFMQAWTGRLQHLTAARRRDGSAPTK